jgi:galactokinase
MEPIDLLSAAKERFQKEFKSEPSVAAYAPGRVNLIGEHVDYNDGFVMPFALPFRTVIVGSLSSGAESCIISLNIEEKNSRSVFKVDSNLSKGSPPWANYVKGTVKQYIGELPEGFAFNAVVISDVPIGSGLSSSASLEVATATFLEKLVGITSVSLVEKSLRCQKAEHTFADTPCGIMDQFISANGKEGSLLLLDCRSNTFELIPFGSGGNGSSANPPVIVVCDSNVKHKLSGSEYPDRVKQCKEAVAALQTKFPQVKALRDATMDMLSEVQAAAASPTSEESSASSFSGANRSRNSSEDMGGNGNGKGGKHLSKKALRAKAQESKKRRGSKDGGSGGGGMSDVAFMRARHCIGEDIRTQGAAKAVANSDWATVGKHMTASHRSLQHDFQVSCSELDFLVDSALTVPGVLGARMTGGGFGGCTVTLCADQTAAEMLMEHFRKVYPVADSFSCVPSAGCGTMDPQGTNGSGNGGDATPKVLSRSPSSAHIASQDEPDYREGAQGARGGEAAAPSGGRGSAGIDQNGWFIPATVAAVVSIAAFIFMRRK